MLYYVLHTMKLWHCRLIPQSHHTSGHRTGWSSAVLDYICAGTNGAGSYSHDTIRCFFLPHRAYWSFSACIIHLRSFFGFLSYSKQPKRAPCGDCIGVIYALRAHTGFHEFGLYLTLILWYSQTYMDRQPGFGGPGPWFYSVLNFGCS